MTVIKLVDRYNVTKIQKSEFVVRKSAVTKKRPPPGDCIYYVTNEHVQFGICNI